MSNSNSNEIVRISSEWLDANKSRAYPFDDSCADSRNRTPSELFTDAFFTVTGLADEALYVSRIVQGPSSFQVYVSTETHDIGLIADISYTVPERTQIAVDLDTGDGITISGFLVVGEAQSVKSMMPSATMTIADGKFFNGCVRSFENRGVAGIRVGDRTYRGVVNLMAGEGVEFFTEETTSETKIHIRAKERLIPKDNAIIVNDKTLLQELVAIYGSPVTTINGVRPNDLGNITLAYPDDRVEGQGFSPFPTDVGTVILQDSSGATVSCENKLIETIMANIAELNERSARHAEAISAIDTANNVMSVSLSRMK